MGTSIAAKLPSQRTVLNGLSGAVALAAGSQAYGITPVSVPANLVSTIGTTTTVTWDVDANATTDYTFQFRYPNSTGASGVVWQANMNPSTGNAVQGYLGAFINYGTNLSLGQNVGATSAAGTSFRTAAQVTLGSIYRSGGVPSNYGGFRPGTPNTGGSTAGAAHGYVGFRLGSGVSARYGWLELEVLDNGGGINFVKAALGSAGEQVVAGIVPEPTSLAALAIGAAAFMRRPRKTESVN